MTNLRDKLKDEHYWDRYMEYHVAIAERISEPPLLSEITSNNENAETLRLLKGGKKYMIFMGMYSAGYSPNELKGFFTEWMQEINNRYGWQINGGVESMILFLSLCYLLKVDRQTVSGLKDLVDNDKKDYIIEYLLYSCGLRDKPDGDIPSFIKLKRFKNYKDMLLSSDRSYNEKKLNTYIKTWYQSQKQRGFWNSHELDDELYEYPGYWVFEAAFVAAHKNLDDRELRKSNYYPSDLVDYYRENS